MKNIIRWFITNTVAANLLMIFIIIAGFFTLSRLRMEVFPDIAIPIINVSVIYPGSSPEDVEESICVKIEEQVQGINGIKKITSTSNEGYGSISVEVENGYNLDDVKDEVKSKVDGITSFPEGAEKPTIRSFEGQPEVITIAVHGEVDEESLLSIAESIREEVSDLPDITQTRLGKKPREISIEVSEQTLQKYGLSFDYISNRIKASSMDVPGGAIETYDGEILIRSKGQAYTGEDFGSIPVLSMSDGSTLLLRDISKIKDEHVANLSKDKLFRRMHVYHQGNLYSGSESFLIMWSQMKKWRLLYRIFSLPLIRQVWFLIYEIAALFLYWKNKSKV